MSKITTTISCNNNLDYLKLAIKSVRQNCYYKDMPLIIHAENCNDGTDEWLEKNKDKIAARTKDQATKKINNGFMSADGIEISKITIAQDIVDALEEDTKDASKKVDDATKKAKEFGPTDADKEQMNQQQGDDKDAKKDDNKEPKSAVDIIENTKAKPSKEEQKD